MADLQLGRMMEAAELSAHASVWIPSELLNQDMDAQLRYLLVSQAEYRHSAILLEGTIRVRKPVPSARDHAF